MKTDTRNTYEKAVNRVIDYINGYLYSMPSIKELSEVANISEYHFHRIFKTIIGENIGEYINRIRLEDIAQRLRAKEYSLQQIAETTGYGTKHALSKAFKKHFGISPSEYCKQPKNIELFFKQARVSYTMVPEIRDIAEKQIVYIRIIDRYGTPESYTKAWHDLRHFAKENNLVRADTEYIGLSFDDPTITLPEKCRFYACFTTREKIKPKGPFGVRTISAGQYAVFLHKGEYQKLIDSYYYIYIKWLPHSSYKLRGTMSFEKYLSNSGGIDEDDLLTEIYIPIKK